MFYNNLIYLLVLIVILSTSGIPDIPQLPPFYALPIFCLKGLFYYAVVKMVYGRGKVLSSADYFQKEQRNSILAVILVALDVYFLDCKYYFSKLPYTDVLPVLADFQGVILFFVYLSINWAVAARSYGFVFGRTYSPRDFVFHNIKMNLPIILPWIILSFTADVLAFVNIPGMQKFFASSWGEPVVFFLFFILLAIIFPFIITRLWNCTPLPPGPVRQRIENFCRAQKLPYADIMTWPLFEGQVITAGVMGFIRPLRYLLVTPALLQTMTDEEVEAVMAHEIGHVKRYHLQLYLLLFLGFGALFQLSALTFFYVHSNSLILLDFAPLLTKVPTSAIGLISIIPFLILLILYFRFIFGFFMRNFERQADLFVFKAIGTSVPLVRVLDKIATLSGNIRDLPSWHHFGIGQRIDYLEKCERDKKAIARHDRKVYLALGGYFILLCIAIVTIWKMPSDFLKGTPPERIEVVIQQRMQEEPQNPFWPHLLGDFQYNRKFFHKAITAYEATLILDPENAEVMNNLAWLLLTAENENVHDPGRALGLAINASRIKPSGYILDTLATAYWRNAMMKEAIEIEKRAIEIDPDNEEYYRKQLEKFADPANAIWDKN